MTSEENLDKDTIEELKHIVESDQQRRYPSFWHADKDLLLNLDDRMTES